MTGLKTPTIYASDLCLYVLKTTNLTYVSYLFKTALTCLCVFKTTMSITFCRSQQTSNGQMRVEPDQICVVGERLGSGGEVCLQKRVRAERKGQTTLHDELRVACHVSLHIRHHRPGRQHQLVRATTKPPPTFLTPSLVPLLLFLLSDLRLHCNSKTTRIED